ncbi:hypothetical protein [Nonomuraea angiospora]|nr:hypothetical protein [Nonomuraea angiospora]MDX3107679.1 hypothetical protein [Nonomuraea angiospora]
MPLPGDLGGRIGGGLAGVELVQGLPRRAQVFDAVTSGWASALH